jgi:cell division protein ZipA
MDSTFFRIIIAISGLLFIAGLVLWDWLHDRMLKKTEALIRQQRQDEFNEEDSLPPPSKAEPLILPSMTAERSHGEAVEEIKSSSVVIEKSIPKLIQVSVVAQRGELFDGTELLKFLAELGLSQGEMGIYHRHFNPQNNDRFSLANLLEPGTFPIDKQQPFSTPGLIIFMEVERQDAPLIVFDEMILTGKKLADKLSGLLLDKHHQPLNEETLPEIREQLTKK